MNHPELPNLTPAQANQLINDWDKSLVKSPCDCNVCELWRAQNFYSERSRLNALSHQAISSKVLTRLKNSLLKEDAIKFPLPKL